MHEFRKLLAVIVVEVVVGVVLTSANVSVVPQEWRGPAFIVVALALILAGTISFVVWVWRDRPAAVYEAAADRYRTGAKRLLRRYYLELHRSRETGHPEGLSPEQVEHVGTPKAWADKVYAEVGLPAEDDYAW